MSPRPRTASDEDILAATYRVISSVGPRFTLADVAKEIGLAPATLLQRFGSKKGLILAVLSSAGGISEDPYSRIRDKAATPLEAVFAYGDCFAQMAPTPEVLANHLAFLQMDLTDPDMHELAFAQAKETRTLLRAWLDEAVAAGELKDSTDTAKLATAIQSMQGGSLLSWAILREGNARRFLRRDLETLIEPYRTARGRTRKLARRSRGENGPARRSPAKAGG
jgi:AcrR family transcriptional regulator